LSFPYSYPAVFRRDSAGRWTVSFRDLPEAHTDGKDERETMAEAIDYLGSALAFRITHREDVPLPSKQRRGERSIPAPLWIAGKLALYRAMREQGVKNTELARRLKVRETVVRRMLDPDHATRTEKLEAALAALGKRIVVGVEDAA